MNIKISELYDRCEEIASTLGLSVNDRFVFDLDDDTSAESIEKTFKGISKILLPQNGRYMVLMVSNEKPSILLAVFPETEDGALKVDFYNIKSQKTLQVTDGLGTEEDPVTIDNFEDALSSDEVEEKVNEFLFSDEDEDNADSDDDTKDDAGDDNHEPEDNHDDNKDDDDDTTFEIIDDEDDDTGDDNEPVSESKKVNEADEPDLTVPPTAPVEPPAAPAEPTPAEPAPVAPETPSEPVVDDPSKNIRDLLKHYTDMLQQASQDESTSTDVVSGIQDIISNLVADLESINKLDEIKDDEAKAAAKAAKDAAKKNGEEVSEDGVPADKPADGITVPVDQAVTLDNPLLASEIVPPSDINAGVSDVTLDPETPPPAIDTTVDVPADDQVVITDIPDDPEIDTKAEMELRGNIVKVGPDGLPTDGIAPTDAQIDSDIDFITITPEPETPTADLDTVEVTPDEPAPAVDTTVDVPNTEVPVVTDAPIDATTGTPVASPAADDVAVDAKIEDELRGDIAKFGPDGLPVGDDIPSDEYIDDQIASLTDKGATDTGMLGKDSVNFVQGDNAINWSDNLYANGKANAEDNDKTVPSALKELKEYAERLNKTVTECGAGACNEVTIGRINKFCNLCNTAWDTWHKIQDAMNASNELCEALKVDVLDECGKMAEDFEQPMECVTKIDDTFSVNESIEADKEFQQVQDYIKSIKKYL